MSSEALPSTVRIGHSWTSDLWGNFPCCSCKISYPHWRLVWIWTVFALDSTTLKSCSCYFLALHGRPSVRSSSVSSLAWGRIAYWMMSPILRVPRERYFTGCFCGSFSWSFWGMRWWREIWIGFGNGKASGFERRFGTCWRCCYWRWDSLQRLRLRTSQSGYWRKVRVLIFYWSTTWTLVLKVVVKIEFNKLFLLGILFYLIKFINKLSWLKQI